MHPKERLAIRERLKRIRKRDVVSSSMDIVPASIDFLDHAIREARADGEKWHLYLIITEECVRCCRHDLEIHYHRQCRSEFPEDPFVVKSLAHALAYEFDFLDQIEPGRVDPALLEAYRLLGQAILMDRPELQTAVNRPAPLTGPAAPAKRWKCCNSQTEVARDLNANPCVAVPGNRYEN